MSSKRTSDSGSPSSPAASAPEAAEQLPKGASFTLHHLTGTRRGEEDRFETDRISIGRGRNNLCHFDPEKERAVSHRHCEIRFEESAFVVYDVGSLNGTYVNGRRVRRTTLTDGDEIGLGREGPRIRFGSSLAPRNPTTERRLPEAPAPKPDVATALRPMATAQESRPLELVTAARMIAGRRYRTLITGLLVATLMIAATGLWVILRQQDQIDDLKNSHPRSTDPIDSPTPPGTRDPRDGIPNGSGVPTPQVPKTAADPLRRSLVVLRVRIQDAQGSIVSERELGAGVVVGPGLVLTTLEICEDAETLLQRTTATKGRSATFVAAPDGNRDEAYAIAQVREARDGSTLPYSDLVLLELADEAAQELPRVQVATSLGRGLKSCSPGVAPADVVLTQFLNARREPVAANEAPTLLYVSGQSSMAGAPILSGNDLAGLGLGSAAPGIAVAPVAIARFIDAAIEAKPRKLRFR